MFVHFITLRVVLIKFAVLSFLQLVQRDGRPAKLRRRDPDHKKLIKSDLVYLEDSPDYCEVNTE